MIGQASISAHLLLKVQVSVAISICLGTVCGGMQANGFWEAAMGVDMALTTTTGGANGLDADGAGCREWTFESKLTNYAEYPPSNGVSTPCHLDARSATARPMGSSVCPCRHRDARLDLETMTAASTPSAQSPLTLLQVGRG